MIQQAIDNRYEEAKRLINKLSAQGYSFRYAPDTHGNEHYLFTLSKDAEVSPLTSAQLDHLAMLKKEACSYLRDSGKQCLSECKKRVRGGL